MEILILRNYQEKNKGTWELSQPWSFESSGFFFLVSRTCRFSDEKKRENTRRKLAREGLTQLP